MLADVAIGQDPTVARRAAIAMAAVATDATILVPALGRPVRGRAPGEAAVSGNNCRIILAEQGIGPRIYVGVSLVFCWLAGIEAVRRATVVGIRARAVGNAATAAATAATGTCTARQRPPRST